MASRGLRWKDLPESVRRTHSPVVIPRGEVDMLKTSGKRITRRYGVARAASMIRHAERHGEYRPGVLEICVEGGRLLTLNELLGVNGAQLTPYKRACHDAVLECVWVALGRTPSEPLFDSVVLHLTRATRSHPGIDADALAASFKYVIDGLRRARVFPDDDPGCVRAIVPRQTQARTNRFSVLVEAVQVEGDGE